MTIRHAVAVVGVLAGVGLAAPAQDPKPKAKADPAAEAVAAAAAFARGTTVANVVPAPFRAQLVVDNRFKGMVKNPDGTESRDPRNRTDKLHCLVCEYGLSPTVAIFVRADLADPKAKALGKMIKDVDGLIPKYRSDKLAAFAMFLKLEGGDKLVVVKAPDGSEEKVEAAKEYPDDEKRDVYAQEISAFAAATNADNVPFGLAPTTSPSIKAFGVGEATPVTVIIYNRLRMAQRWDLKLDDINDAKTAEILAATEKMIGVEPKKQEAEKDEKEKEKEKDKEKEPEKVKD
jgi:hypothetical protein